MKSTSCEWLKSLLQSGRGSSALTSLDFFLLGAVSKILATLATYPVQTLKSQLQKSNSPYASSGILRGFLDATRDLAKSPEGITSFYRGLRAKILQTGLTAAFLFVFRERLIVILTKWLTLVKKVA